MRTAVFEFNRYSFPSGLVYSIVPRTASRRLICPWIVPSQVGAWESSKSAMKTLAPEFRALMIILRSTGPVISTRRSSRSFGGGATFQSASRRALVSGRKSGRIPAAILSRKEARRRRSAFLRGPKERVSSARNSRALGVRISSYARPTGARTLKPFRRFAREACAVWATGPASASPAEGGAALIDLPAASARRPSVRHALSMKPPGDPFFRRKRGSPKKHHREAVRRRAWASRRCGLDGSRHVVGGPRTFRMA